MGYAIHRMDASLMTFDLNLDRSLQKDERGQHDDDDIVGTATRSAA